MDLAGVHVVVIGGSSGIGEATARQAQQQGASVTIASRTMSNLRSAHRRLGGAFQLAEVDITDQASVAALFEGAGAINHVVVTAGDSEPGGVLSISDDAANRSLRTRFWGPVYVARAAAKRIVSGGSITLVSGTGGWKPHAGWEFSHAVAGAVEPLCRALASELAPHVRVNAICPGTVRTARTDRNHGGPARADDYIARRSLSLPLRRVGAPDDIAGMIISVATNMYMTGQIVQLDGGASLL